MKNLIKELREKRGLTQKELADEMLVSRQTINSLETGKYNPSILLAYKIAKFFGVIIEQVFIFDEEWKIQIQHYILNKDVMKFKGGDLLRI